MRWVFENLQLIIFVFVAISVVRAAMRARKEKAERGAGHDETDEQRRVREIQERIRKIAAERGGRGVLTPAPVAPDEPPPMLYEERPAPAPQPDPFGGPGRRTLLDEIQRRLQVPAAPPPAQPTVAARAEHELERDEERQTLAEAQAVLARRAAQRAAAKHAETRTEGALLGSAHTRLLADLRDPQSLRRAFVLREVLGTPVGLK